MKRIIIVLLALFLILACQPTPEQEYIVNKGDDVVEEKLSATPKAETGTMQPETGETETAGPTEGQRFPDRWDAEPVEVLAGFTIAANAEILNKADGRYPVYRTKPIELTKAMAETIAEKVLGKPVGAGDYVMTKEDWKKELQAYLDEVDAWNSWVAAGKPNDGIDRDETGYTPEGVEQRTNWYMEQIKKAPDELTSDPVRDYSGLQCGQAMIYTLADGGNANVLFFDDYIEISKTKGDGYLYTAPMRDSDLRYEEPEAKQWKQVALEYEAAEKMLQKELKRLDLTEYTVKWAFEANFFELFGEGVTKNFVSSGWTFTLHRNPAGYPEAKVPYAPSQELQYGTSDAFLANKPIGEETITVYIDENGMQYFLFNHPREITGIANPNVELLPWDEVQNRVIQSLTMCFPIESFKERLSEEIPIEIYSMLLTTYTVHEKNGDGYYEMPCWIVFFDGQDTPAYRKMGVDEASIAEMRSRDRSDKNLTHDVLILNAVDGSIVHTDYGY